MYSRGSQEERIKLHERTQITKKMHEGNWKKKVTENQQIIIGNKAEANKKKNNLKSR